ncbi:MAG: PQQ-binding-like beta-propeller repeat protein [Planctomycetaceae bacterium]|nr:PQQ-binding-like beta-propeller repeat protein [Planctomycetaceae bacterium]
MMKAVRAVCLFLGVCLFTQSASAQFQVELPREADLNRLGLTLNWWGQAVIDPQRDTITFLRADEQNVYAQASSGIITAFGGESGTRMWSNLIGRPDRESFPVTTNDEQVLVSIGMSVFALDKASGNLQWEVVSPIHPSAPPQLTDRQLFVGTSDGSIYAYDIRMIDSLARRGMLPQWIQRARQWRFKTPREITSTPVAVGTTVTFASQSGIVYGVSDGNKKLKFQFESDGKIETQLGATGDAIFVADTNARLYCINTVTGAINWMFSSGAPINQQPIAIGSQVFVIPQRAGMSALSVVGGFEKWRQPEAVEFIAASESRIYAKDGEGRLLVMDRENGAIVGILNLRRYSLSISNERTDRIILATPSGTVVSIREISSDYPVYHLYPERRPLLPMMAPEEDAPPADTSVEPAAGNL